MKLKSGSEKGVVGCHVPTEEQGPCSARYVGGAAREIGDVLPDEAILRTAGE